MTSTPGVGAVAEEVEEKAYPEVLQLEVVHSVQRDLPNLLTEVVILKVADPAKLIGPVHSKKRHLTGRIIRKTGNLQAVPREKITSRTGRTGRIVAERTGRIMVKRNNQAGRNMETTQEVKDRSMPKDIITMNGMVDIAIMKTGKTVKAVQL